jgi:UTP--glucose-1-phosphate uridylyltransferase
MQEQALGLGHALLQARDNVSGVPFILILPDDVLELDEMNVWKMIDARKPAWRAGNRGGNGY